MACNVRRKLIISWSVDHMLPTIFSLYTFLLCSSLLYCSAKDTITFNSSITDKRGETLVSDGKIFELGFFTPKETWNSRRYVGIWYHNNNITQKTVVWVANRDRPLSDQSGIFNVTEDGNLHVWDGKGKSQWSTNLNSSSSRRTAAKLMDSGNLVLRDETSTEILWESFRHPTDTFLPGMKMDDATLNLTSWKREDDPAPGNFTFKRDEKGEDQFQILRGKWTTYWKSGESGNLIDTDVASLLSNSSMSGDIHSSSSQIDNSNTKAAADSTSSQYPQAGVYDDSNHRIHNDAYPNNPAYCRSRLSSPYRSCFSPPNSSTRNNSNPKPLSRLVMSFDGAIQYLIWVGKKNWLLIWWAPKNRCGALNVCGTFGSCNSNNTLVCKCVPGFKPRWEENYDFGDFSDGCEPKSPICRKNTDDKIETFLRLKMMKVRDPDKNLTVESESECKKQCVDNCDCQAYSYAAGNTTACSIWTADLSNLQEEYADGGRNLSVRVNISDTKFTVKDCETCGTNMIPYPLSTGEYCGDSMYLSFRCNSSTGQVSFEALSGSYRVTSIDRERQTFSIQVKDAGKICRTGHGNSISKILRLNESLPFRVKTDWCNADPDNPSSNTTLTGGDEIELGWAPPPEPTCNSSTDCTNWPDSTCNIAPQDGKKRCLCNEKLHWNVTVLNCTRSEEKRPPRNMSQSMIIGVTSSTVVVLIALSCTIIYYSHLRRRRAAERKRNEELHLYDSERHVKDLVEAEQFGEEDKKRIAVPFFDLKTIQVATNNFSDENKLGKGGFGPVYKGKFSGGQEIAVKRLSNVSGQGLEEFKNEVVLIAKLQHRNLVRLLGYCIKGEEKILLYEYMPNKSLDSFIFDRTRCVLLDWELRFNIILGIARGLLYLHQDSRLKIIHRDLKTSNILLDEEMSPKISDFGLARIFDRKQTEANTIRVAGTYGYMSPEYALDGCFSVKSDVYSFGVVVLEIISGKKATGFYEFEQALNLQGHAWRLWNEDKALDLMDQTLCETCNANEFMKYVNVGLLCVQDDARDRPTMSNVVVMLESENAMLPTPKQPIFIGRRGPASSTNSSSSKTEACSNNKLTNSIEEGR